VSTFYYLQPDGSIDATEGGFPFTATPLLQSFIAERGRALAGEWVMPMTGHLDLHPGIRWCPSDVAPGMSSIPDLPDRPSPGGSSRAL
jgi:hypothetical protein